MEEIMNVVAEETLENAVEEATQNAVSSGTNPGMGAAILVGAAGAVATIFVVKGAVKLGKKVYTAGKGWIQNKRAKAAECDQEAIDVDFTESTEESE